ncbi:uncharacterized protein LOC130689104 [Daphnia carinata]|uniref:uncharacterized protein LOC130689104 n=1 Tax=Daphnia carinata TaxID=120202 RepID=UPI00257BDB39|nr:uncharacterized protein LOC130689104 [Daphnia carinata]
MPHCSQLARMAKNGRITVVVRPRKLSSSNNNRRQKIHPTSSTPFNFDWSLKPMTVWFQLFGLQPPIINKDQKDRRFLLLIPVTIIFYVLTIGCNTFVMSQTKWIIETKNYTSITQDWNSIINQVNYCFLTTTTHSALLFVSYFMSWKRLTDLLRRLEQGAQFDNSHYKKFRRIFQIGSWFVLIEIAIELVETLIYRLWISSIVASLSTSHVVFSALNMVSLIFPYLGSVLFCSLGWMASVVFQIMAEEIDSANVDSSDCLAMTYFINQWRRRYFLVVEFVDEMSRHFGVFLLVVTASEFVRMTNTSFHLLTELLGHRWTLSTILIAVDYIKETLCFCFLLYIPSRIYREANDMIRKLRMTDANEVSLQNQMRFLAEEMIQSLPNITPMGMVHINVQLIPTLMGTTLTYLIILCQFQSLETIDDKR